MGDEALTSSTKDQPSGPWKLVEYIGESRVLSLKCGILSLEIDDTEHEIHLEVEKPSSVWEILSLCSGKISRVQIAWWEYLVSNWGEISLGRHTHNR